MDDSTVGQRKNSHLDLCATEEVEPSGNSALFDDVRLAHCALPEMAVADVDCSVPLFGKRLRYPLLMTGMTGGTERAHAVNVELASAAEEWGVAFGVGSQRAMSELPEKAWTFQVRQAAPTAVLIGNIGVVQAAAIGVDGVRRLFDAISADGMAVHLNVGQELIQPEGDRDFSSGLKTIEGLVQKMGDRLLVKETGCGISPAVAQKLRDIGVKHIDVSGLGGTSWIRVEQLRAQGHLAKMGALFSQWGIPTAAAVASGRKAVGEGVSIIASGGVRDGLDVAKAVALGADIAGMALPFFRAQQAGGRKEIMLLLESITAAFTYTLVLTGSKTPRQLRDCPKVITGALKEWMSAL
jgi:isopentenyl-diphosphate delta-isomerase